MTALSSTLNKTERELLLETDRERMDRLDEDGLVELHRRIRRARKKYVKLYRRAAAGNVKKSGGRGKARPKNSRNARKAEIFEDALARVSRRLAVAAKESAATLKAERLDAARNAPGKGPGPAVGKARSGSGVAADGRVVNRGQKSPGRKKREASSRAAGARRQAKRDSR